MYETITLPAFTSDGTWYGGMDVEVQYTLDEGHFPNDKICKVWYRGIDILPIIKHLNAFESLVKIISHANTHP